MAAKITIRQLTNMADLTATVDLQKAVWQMHDVEVASPHTLRAIVHSGGTVIGAEAAGRMVGFCTGFGALRDGQLFLWSHMAAVHPDLQGGNIGFRLKQAQREWALAKGFQLIAWTFDPLQSGNANFNFNRLGVIARSYSENHYGEMQDGINAGLASDRLEAQWQLEAPHVLELAQGRRSDFAHRRHGAEKLLYIDGTGQLFREQPSTYDAERYALEIPANIADLKRQDLELAVTWQLHLRAAMTALLAAGYVVTAFSRDRETASYFLSRES